MSDSEALLVVAIDFGTTFSGYAFQFKHEYNPKDPTKINAPQCWNDGHTQVMSLKTPTCLLLDQFLRIDSFGYEADRKYTELCLESNDAPKKWYFFKHFKMKLQERELLKVDAFLEDEGKKPIPAQKVFALSIQCLKKKLTDWLDEKKADLREDDIRWVLTVPAIWDDSAKSFMRGAASMAGIKTENLMIALEPEAASMYCQFLPIERFAAGGGQHKVSLATPGTIYMVCDLGGGTADITMHEKLRNGKLKEVHSACGGPWGGNAVDANYLKLIEEIVGPSVMREFRSKYKADFLCMMAEFEASKRNVGPKTETKTTVKVPYALFELCKDPKLLGKELKTAVQECKHASKVKVVGDKLRVDAELIKECFKKVTDCIIAEMRKCIMETMSTYGVDLILMVGGFSESLYVQSAVFEQFEEKMNMSVLLPHESGLSVLKGAVIFGRQPETISSRILRFTYGAEITPRFEQGYHDAKHKNEDGTRCNKVFQPFIQMGTDVDIGHGVKMTYNTIHPDQKTIGLKIYCLDKITGSRVHYTDEDGFRYLGTLSMEITNPTYENQDVDVTYKFGQTEVVVTALEKKTGKNCVTVLKIVE